MHRGGLPCLPYAFMRDAFEITQSVVQHGPKTILKTSCMSNGNNDNIEVDVGVDQAPSAPIKIGNVGSWGKGIQGEEQHLYQHTLGTLQSRGPRI